MPKSSGAAKSLSSDFSSTARATGNNISVVDVLDIHMLKKALASINPKTNLRELLPPNRRTIYRAMRLCAPLRSSAVASRKPPIINKTRGLP